MLLSPKLVGCLRCAQVTWWLARRGCDAWQLRQVLRQVCVACVIQRDKCDNLNPEP